MESARFSKMKAPVLGAAITAIVAVHLLAGCRTPGTIGYRTDLPLEIRASRADGTAVTNATVFAVPEDQWLIGKWDDRFRQILQERTNRLPQISELKTQLARYEVDTGTTPVTIKLPAHWHVIAVQSETNVGLARIVPGTVQSITVRMKD